MRIKILLVTLLMFMRVSYGYCESSIDLNGQYWIELNTPYKNSLIAGLIIGSSPSFLDDNSASPGLTSKAGVGDYIEDLNSFYSQPKYLKIKIVDGFRLSSIKLKENDSNDYGHMLTMLLNGKRLPYHVQVTEIIDGDTIKVKDLVSDDKWTVNLIGIDAPEINQKKQTDKEPYGMKAKKYLEALLLDSEGDLEYTEDVFNQKGMLLAKYIDQQQEKRTAYKLLEKGLVKPYPFKEDPIRNYDISTSLTAEYKACETWAKIARDKKLYIWGDKTDPHVESTVKGQDKGDKKNSSTESDRKSDKKDSKKKYLELLEKGLEKLKERK
ncbi:MAG: thermonuclease family protein [Deltaproteobacteria bacterium]|nr:thermonuclease family protein [Deltaproteobacteria bacterium]